MMMGGMMMWMLLLMVFGALLFLALIAAVIWLLVRAFRSPRQPTMQQRQTQPQYERGYSSSAPGFEAYEEGGRTYPYSEQPSARYPHAPLQ